VRSAGARSIGSAVGLSLALATGALGGCAGDGEREPSAVRVAEPGTGGVLSWAISRRPEDVDPLRAATRGEQLLSRQVHEPLVAELAAPFAEGRRLPGLALSARASSDFTIWRLRLRRGVRFQDGSLFNAGAVVANGVRWRTTAQGQGLMPDLFAVDSPRPDLARFFLERPDRNFPALLASPRAGIVSPGALFPSSGEGAALRRTARSGTGPFELRESDRDGVVLARNLAWWGAGHDLGPALDQVELRVVPPVTDRLALLRAGDVQVAERLGPDETRIARRDPLLEVMGGPEEALGLERSVRGIDSATEIPSFSELWVTRVGSG
jgi:peptide/nickel transport system substrate-binding protein